MNIKKRMLDIFLASIAMIILSAPLLCIAIGVKLTSSGPILYWSKRIGKNNTTFWMPKFRSMLTDTPEVATDLLVDPKSQITAFGRVLRKWSLDELPQIWCVIAGTMSVVGPRPALYNQNDLIEARGSTGVSSLVPGLTGLAQINGRDSLSLEQKIAYEKQYLDNRDTLLDIIIIVKTFGVVLFPRNVSH